SGVGPAPKESTACAPLKYSGFCGPGTFVTVMLATLAALPALNRDASPNNAPGKASDTSIMVRAPSADANSFADFVDVCTAARRSSGSARSVPTATGIIWNWLASPRPAVRTDIGMIDFKDVSGS